MMQNTTEISNVPGLNREGWETAVKTAEESVKAKLHLPDEAEPQYKVRAFSKYPQWLIIFISVLLLIVAVAAFWISAGKQIAATATILDPLGTSYNHLSGTWSNMGDLFALAFGEGATILFMLASSVIPGEKTPIRLSEEREIEIRPAVFIFRFFAVACASLAIVANVSITAMHDTAGQPLYTWMFAGLPPVTVLAIGLIVENLIMGTLKARADTKARFETDTDAYYAVLNDPTRHKEWNPTLSRCIWDELIRLKKRRDIIQPLVEAYPDAQRALIVREYRVNMAWENMGFELSMNRPTSPSLDLEQPAAGSIRLQPVTT